MAYLSDFRIYISNVDQGFEEIAKDKFEQENYDDYIRVYNKEDPTVEDLLSFLKESFKEYIESFCDYIEVAEDLSYAEVFEQDWFNFEEDMRELSEEFWSLKITAYVIGEDYKSDARQYNFYRGKSEELIAEYMGDDADEAYDYPEGTLF
ncbi:hypothetical protein [Capnocytophaga sputigena]|jgi:hypothetical protein|uniref:hypothetical protein n=1 Tax=Capnocytophaga sputigena TaxID=1019 RepID=UPI000F6F6F0E|nr:hypothetical protein [Capnocytophaga sputigena]VEI55593.1 Uncharacterised protein [Capnocytophaga sputigena]